MHRRLAERDPLTGLPWAGLYALELVSLAIWVLLFFLFSRVFA